MAESAMRLFLLSALAAVLESTHIDSGRVTQPIS